MDGKSLPREEKAGGGVDAWTNIFVERLWRSRTIEEVYLNAYARVDEAKAGLCGAWLTLLQRGAPVHQSMRLFARRPEAYEADARDSGRAAKKPTAPHSPIPSTLGKRGSARLPRPHTNRHNPKQQEILYSKRRTERHNRSRQARSEPERNRAGLHLRNGSDCRMMGPPHCLTTTNTEAIQVPTPKIAQSNQVRRLPGRWNYSTPPPTDRVTRCSFGPTAVGYLLRPGLYAIMHHQEQPSVRASGARKQRRQGRDTWPFLISNRAR